MWRHPILFESGRCREVTANHVPGLGMALDRNDNSLLLPPLLALECRTIS
jgi:hypothetical protein